MKTLEQLSVELDDVEKTASKSLEDIPQANRPAWASAIASAKLRLEALLTEYKDALVKTGILIFLEGDRERAGELATLVTKENEGLVVDATALYERVANAIEPSLSDCTSTRQSYWGVHQVYIMNNLLQQVMSEVGLQEMDMPDRTTFPIVKTHQDLVNHIRQAVRSSVGDGLNRLYLIRQMLDQTKKIRYIGIMTPVMVLNASEEEQAGLSLGFGHGATTISMKADDTVDKPYMVKAFKEISKRIRKK